jgi:hypothetical protein
LEEKAGKKKGTSAPAAVFQGPLRPKKQTWFFFLEKMAGQEKRTKKETLRKFSNTESGKEKIRWLLIYWSKLLIARAETSRDFGC